MKRRILIVIFLISLQTFLNIQVQATEKADNLFKPQISNTQILKEQAIISYKKGNYKEAINYLAVVTCSSIDDESFILIANSYDKLGNFKKASDYLEKAIEVNPKNSYAYYNLAILNFNNGNIHIALNNFERAIKNNKNFSAAHYNTGICYYKVGNYKKALKYFHKAHKLSPNNPNVSYNLALTYETLNNNKKAQKYYNLHNFLSESNKKNTN
ncbi:MAG: hypothetical protein A2255_10390 [Candidatus Melainabacteria bacterium RIFOXYA2_FULL_32_9]|nr:MAG: hypothetical protein A2255_10390 [Candidatus Melainabacteria bacterium RIFOXYA2_FULL_32_9]